ncbi:hypothetical protein H920_14661 [Fukomys damarensis]|uniref:Uncharacterized protein n=1 Tax=Fukomys damarensis TaxID=885580 RepID=A0A091D192_FUKDA|nr:hypothetical protein H920_14661 [Fukomys damarensis]
MVPETWSLFFVLRFNISAANHSKPSSHGFTLPSSEDEQDEACAIAPCGGNPEPGGLTFGVEKFNQEGKQHSSFFACSAMMFGAMMFSTEAAEPRDKGLQRLELCDRLPSVKLTHVKHLLV